MGQVVALQCHRLQSRVTKRGDLGAKERSVEVLGVAAGLPLCWMSLVVRPHVLP